jgi:hypothetical protein
MYAPEIMDILLIFFFHFHPQFLKHGHILITCSTTCTYLKHVQSSYGHIEDVHVTF